MDWPEHNVNEPDAIEMVGNGFKFTITEVVFEQPLALVPVTVYVVLDVGFAVTVVPVVELSPVAGDQE